VARECAQAWGQSRPSSSAPAPSPVPSSPVPVPSPSNVSANSPVPKGPPKSSTNDENWTRIKSLLDTELLKIPESDYIDFHPFVDKFMSTFSLPARYRPSVYQVVQAAARKRRCRWW